MAVEQKENKSIVDVLIDVTPLPDGSKLINQEDILLTIKRSFGFNLTGKPLAALDIERLERIMREDPFVKEATVFVDAQNQVNIHIQQRNPILRIVDNNGLNYYLDGQGNKMPISRHYTPRLLTATGNLPPHSPDFLERKSHILKDAFELAQLLLTDPFFEPLIEQIHVTNRREFILVPKIGKQTIEFGRYANAEKKLANLKAFYKEGLPYTGWQKYSTFNVRFEGQVVAKK